jgi:hypothetical protein
MYLTKGRQIELLLCSVLFPEEKSRIGNIIERIQNIQGHFNPPYPGIE